ncbi:hypothetical protein ABQ333_15350 [Serratia fonticola]|uniref:hypothetical protein n=1 Tax=Serratia fonticola TaxID=47917 RepID=UPI003AAE1A55
MKGIIKRGVTLFLMIFLGLWVTVVTAGNPIIPKEKQRIDLLQGEGRNVPSLSQGNHLKIATVRLIAKNPGQLATRFREELGFKVWSLGALPSGEEIYSVLLKGGQTIEIISWSPSYIQFPIDDVKALMVGIQVNDMGQLAASLQLSALSPFPIVPVHVGGDPKQRKMFELQFINSPWYAFNGIYFIKRFEDEIAKVRQERPEFDDRPWQDQKNGVTSINTVWFAVKSIENLEKRFFWLGLISKDQDENGLIVFQIGDTQLKVVSPSYAKLSDSISKRLSQYGEGIFRIELGVETNTVVNQSSKVKIAPGKVFSLTGMDTELVFVAAHE